MKEWVEIKNVQQILLSKNIFNDLKIEAINEKDDIYLKTDLILIVIKIFNTYAVDFDSKYFA